MDVDEFYTRMNVMAELGLIERLSNGIELLGYKSKTGKTFLCDTEDYTYLKTKDKGVIIIKDIDKVFLDHENRELYIQATEFNTVIY